MTTINGKAYLDHPQAGALYGWEQDGQVYTVRVTRVYAYAGRMRIQVETVNGEKIFRDAAFASGHVEYTQQISTGRWPQLVALEPPQPAKPTLLQLALAGAKPQWYSGESVWLLGHKAYLSNHGGLVCLHILGYGPYCIVFLLDPHENAWKVARNLEANYRSWAAGYLAKHPRRNGEDGSARTFQG